MSLSRQLGIGEWLCYQAVCPVRSPCSVLTAIRMAEIHPVGNGTNDNSVIRDIVRATNVLGR